MDKELRLYVSASPEMGPECELLGQLLASMPKSIKWVIKRTPGRHQGGNPDVDALLESQFYLLLLGMDIMAPMGVEWRTAKGASLTTFAYRNMSTPPSPAAAHFSHYSAAEWQTYQTPREFIQYFEHALCERLIEGTPGYGLGLADIRELTTRLRARREEEESPKGGDTSTPDDRRGAARGGVILPAR